MATIPTGRFVWFDYVSKHADKAQAFYGELFHWKTQQVPMQAGSYTMIVSGDKTIGGYMTTPKGAPEHAHWLSHLQVADAAATVAKIKQSGGKVRKDAEKMGDFGTMAIVADPFETTFALWQPGKAEGTGDYLERDNTWCWNELASPDPDKAVAFYSAIGGFHDKPMPMGEMGTYHVLEADGKPRAGVAKPMNAQAPTIWTPYVQVGNADQTTARAQKLGATIYVPATDIPNVGRFAIFGDPNGAVTGILQPPKR